MVNLVIFDLDGVLVEAKNIHYEALNEALGKYAISWQEHLSTYDGLKTTQKLEMLTEQKGLPIEEHQVLWETKQYITHHKLKELKSDDIIIELMSGLVTGVNKITVCYKSIRKKV